MEQAASTQTGMCTDVVCFSLSPPPQRDHGDGDDEGTGGRADSCSKSTSSNNNGNNNNRSHVDGEHRGARCGGDNAVGAAPAAASGIVGRDDNENTDNDRNYSNNRTTTDKSVNNNGSNGDHNGEGCGESEGGEWQEIVVPHDNSLRGREWRVLVKSCQVVDMKGESEQRASRVVGARDGSIMSLELELKEVKDEPFCSWSAFYFSYFFPCDIV